MIDIPGSAVEKACDLYMTRTGSVRERAMEEAIVEALEELRLREERGIDFHGNDTVLPLPDSVKGWDTTEKPRYTRLLSDWRPVEEDPQT